ncbi:threonine/serine exporter family protein [Shewanella sp. D64]|uniref:threonine/serine ThrE exporter family protein n=1 Tax=unclassified Shewanella TaxID=196818 RepID=UPI0022BA58BB|nr:MULTISPECIES: threonine/serine exporter family protein [unclassified Shewanella]MEC4727445.1 threonine/serine exporter family protein [Shewanella sp. D64]MEC4739600.1 threonine/serine exporter family protein [Shewanella sp. E94]WBJ96018.1 threonine/serine exporter family protein [Shewanella sp. MTB7]
MDNQAFLEKRKFIIKLGKYLHKFGTPAYRLEAHLQAVSNFLGLEGYFLISPTAMTFVLQRNDEQEYNHVARVKPGELDLGSLARTDELVEELVSGKRSLNEALERLDEIANKPPPYGPLLTLLAFGSSAGAFAMLMETSWNDVFWSALLGIMVFGLVYRAEHSKRMAEMLEPLAAILCAFITCGIAQLDPSINIPVVILSGIIVFIPGLALTLGLAELASRDLISGTARIMDACMQLFKLYFGVIFGMVVGTAIFGEALYLEPDSLPSLAIWSAVPILSMALVIIFKARMKDAPWGVLAGIVAFCSSMLGGIYLGDSIGIFFGAFAVGVYSNLFARWMKAPASIALLQGIVILVPGSKTYIGLNTLISGETMLNQSHIGSQIFLIFMSLIAGLIFANVAVSPRRTL